MGYIRHDAVVILVGQHDGLFNKGESGAGLKAMRDFIANVPKRVLEIFEEIQDDAEPAQFDLAREAQKFVGLFAEFEPTINSTYTFFMAPDSSKEGWWHSDVADKLREEFISAAREHTEFATILHLSGFGGDDNVLDIPFSTLSKVGKVDRSGLSKDGHT